MAPTKSRSSRSRASAAHGASADRDGAPSATPGGPPRTAYQYSGIPGVYVNATGAHVDERGVLLSWADVRSRERELDAEIIGEPADTPAKFLKRIAMDNRLPLATRIDAANKAAPYYDAKMPLKFEGAATVGGIDLSALAALPKEERVSLLALLQKIGVSLTLPNDAAPASQQPS